jgi:hypothetical protein
MKKLALIVGVVLMVLVAANAGFAAQIVSHGGHHGSYGHNWHYYGNHGGYYSYYPGYRYVASSYVIGAPGIYVAAPYGPRVILRAIPY